MDNFLQFKSIMVTTNTELNNRAMDELTRNGMLHSHQNQLRNVDTPPPPYTEEYQGNFLCKNESSYCIGDRFRLCSHSLRICYVEDVLRYDQLVGDEVVESFVRDLSTNLQKFEDTVREQQDTIRCNIGVQLGDGKKCKITTCTSKFYCMIIF